MARHFGAISQRNGRAGAGQNLVNYFRTTPDNRLLFGGRARFAVSNPNSDQKSGAILQAALHDIFPELRPARIDDHGPQARCSCAAMSLSGYMRLPDDWRRTIRLVNFSIPMSSCSRRSISS